MQIYLLRHGIAEDARPGLRDFDRALTPEGSQKLRRVLDRAAPPGEAWGEIRGHGQEPAVLLASHEPLMSSLAAFLLDSPTLVVDMKKAALVRIDCERTGLSPSGVLKWMLTPAVAGD